MTAQDEKNAFVISLRDYLMAKYSTNNHHTFGESDFEAEVKDGAYALKRRDPKKLRDYIGFVLRKDLCAHRTPRDAQALTHDISDFVDKYNFADKIVRGSPTSMTLNFSGENYLIVAQYDSGYAGEFGISVAHMPSWEQLRRNFASNM